MTFAGLLGLAVGRGISKSNDGPRALLQDNAIDKGLSFLSKRIGQPGRTPGRIGADAHGDLYYLWSLERVAVVYNLKSIAGKEWYRWGADVVAGQQPNGSWYDRFDNIVDTSFALLFLKRANIVQDLTSKLQNLGS